MSAYGGPDIVEDGLVLALDAANVKSFRGEPTTNILQHISNTTGISDTAFFKVNYGADVVTLPGIGKRTAYFCNIYNEINGSGQCCPSLFGFGGINVSPSTTYTYQIIYRTLNGYEHPNYMYRYEYTNSGGGGYVTEAGVWSADRVENLGDGWRHAWGTFTTSPITNYIITYLFHYEYNFLNKVEVADVCISQRNTPHPAKYIPRPLTTRGTTVATGGGWADMSGNSNHGELINNPTFNSANGGSLVFDGVNDYITLPTNIFTTSLPNFSISVWYNNSTLGIFLGNHYHDSTWESIWTSTSQFVVNGTGTEVRQVLNFTATTFNNWNNLTFVNNSSSSYMKVFNNGSEIASNSVSVIPWNSSILPTIGSQLRTNGTFVDPITGRIASLTVYNRALTAAEILQNYNATKGRYGL